MKRRSYHQGRLLAALEHLGVAQPHRLYMQASVHPAAMTAALSRATELGTEAQDIIAPIMAELQPDAFGTPFSEIEEADFPLGYYHQRADFARGCLPTLSEAEPDLNDRMEIRLEPELKAWVLANGGARLVRALLREAREHH